MGGLFKVGVSGSGFTGFTQIQENWNREFVLWFWSGGWAFHMISSDRDAVRSVIRALAIFIYSSYCWSRCVIIQPCLSLVVFPYPYLIERWQCPASFYSPVPLSCLQASSTEQGVNERKSIRLFYSRVIEKINHQFPLFAVPVPRKGVSIMWVAPSSQIPNLLCLGFTQTEFYFHYLQSIVIQKIKRLI